MSFSRFYIIPLLLTICFSLSAEDKFGDYATRKYSVIPPSPEVASMMKYVDIPVSYFTGQPQIEIPIYTITEGSLSVPISLSYKGGGIKQNELPGLISSGWTLMAGMTISRSVYGLPDECNINESNPFWMRGLFNISQNDKDLRNRIINQNSEFEPSALDPRNVISYQKCSDYEAGRVDFANDIYKFYGLNMNGSFIFDENQNITMSTGSPITLDSFHGWKHFDYSMTDKDQTSYSFGQAGVEITETPICAEGYNINVEMESNMEKIKYESAWHITQMKSIYGDIINFEYAALNHRTDYLGPTQYYYYYLENNYSNFNYFADRAFTSTSKTTYDERKLVAIKTKSTTLRFHYNNDISQLESISVHKNDSDTTELWRYNIIRDTYGNMTEITQTANSKTLQLYGFSYLSKNCKNSFSIDYWGYCNGADNGSTILPNIKGYETIPYKRSNREPNETYSKQGILDRISYSTGGYTKLNWEQNDYSYIKDNGSYLSPNPHTTTTTESIQLRGTQISQRLSSGTYSMKKGDSFVIDLSTYLAPLMRDASVFQLEFEAEYNYRHANYTDIDDKNNPYPYLAVYKNGTIYKKYYIDKNNSGSKIYIAGDNATFKFEIKNPRNFAGMSDIDINAFWGMNATTDYRGYGYINIVKKSYITEEEAVIRPWGGLRIASIQSVPNIGNSVIKNYSYKKNFNGREYSSGVIKSIPNYTFFGGAYFPYLNGGYSFAEMTGICSNGIASSTNGESGIEYSVVWESFQDEEIGKIGYFYDTQRVYPDEEDCLFSGYVPAGLKTLTSNAFKRGLLKEKHYVGSFSDFGVNDALYKEETFDYNLIEGHSNTFTGPLSSIWDFSEISYSDGAGDFLNKNYTINKFRLIPYNKQIKSQTVWETDFLTNIETKDTISYTYYGTEGVFSNKPWNSFVKSKSYTNSKNQNVSTYYTYYKRNNIPVDLKELEISVVDDVVMSVRRNVYDNNNRLIETYSGCVGMNFSNNFTLPSSLLEEGTYPSVDKKEYSYKYNPMGNIVQICYNGRVIASYLWGYMGKHPIVEVLNISYDELYTIANSHGYIDGIYSNDLDLLLNAIRADSRLQGKEVNTFTYHWLLGIATSTDSRGVKRSYMLDDFGRLNGIKDTNGYFIKKYEYNYKGL